MQVHPKYYKKLINTLAMMPEALTIINPKPTLDISYHLNIIITRKVDIIHGYKNFINTRFLVFGFGRMLYIKRYLSNNKECCKVEKIITKISESFSIVIDGVSALSYKGLIVGLIIGGTLYMFGNEHGAKETCKKAIYGYLIIQLANMLV